MMGVKDYLALIGITLAILIVGVIAICTPAYYGARYACKAKAEQMGLEYEYGVAKGCFVRDDGRWIPMEQLRSMR